MKKTVCALAFAALAGFLAFGQSGVVSIQNQETSVFWYTVDPAELEGLSAGSPQLASKVAEFFAAQAGDPQFIALAPEAVTKLQGLSDGAHLLVGFFEVKDQDEFPVRVVSLQADSRMGERSYPLFSSPALINASRGIGRLAQFSKPAAVTAEAAVAETAAPPAETAAAAEAPAAAPEAAEPAPAAEGAPVEAAAVEAGAAPAEAAVAETAAPPAETAAAAEAPAAVSEAAEPAPAAEGATAEAAAVEAGAAPAEAAAVETAAPPAEMAAAAEAPAAALETAPAAEGAPAEAAAVEAGAAPAEALPESIAPALNTVALFSENYEPAYFTRENSSGFEVFPISDSQSWAQAGTRLTELLGSVSEGTLTLSITAPRGFSGNVSYFFYIFGTREPGKGNTLTLELQPYASGGGGVCLLWRKGAAAPSLVGRVSMNDSYGELDIRADQVPADALAELGDDPTVDFTACAFDRTSGTYEEFYYTTFSVADLVATR